MISEKKRILVEKATELFAEGGYTAVGIDRIIAESGVAKMTMYKYFPSKNSLILEVLKERDSAFRSSLMAYVEQYDTLIDRIKAVFRWHDIWFNDKKFFGCMFINASAEFHDHKDEIHKIAAEHKQLIITYLETLLLEEYPLSAKKLAIQINILIDGAIVSAHVAENQNAAIDALEAAESLLKSVERVDSVHQTCLPITSF